MQKFKINKIIIYIIIFILTIIVLLKIKLSNNVDGRINFYGRVIDLAGIPINNVSIIAHIEKYGPNPTSLGWKVVEVRLKTDANGNFNISGERGIGILFYEIKKNGYEYLYLNSKDDFNYEPGTNNIFHPDKNNPIIFKMRKKGAGAFIRINERTGCFNYDRSESGTRKGYDLIFGEDIQGKSFAHPMAGAISLVCDIETMAKYDKSAKKWRMIIEPGDSQGGILISNKLLYEAPVNGYSKSIVIDSSTFNKEFGLEENYQLGLAKYINVYGYLKSRTPPIYSRFSISGVRANDQEIHFEAGGFKTNPYGERNLEVATNIPVELETKLAEEVHDAYSNGRRPVKPDLSNLKEEKEENTLPWYVRLWNKLVD